MGGWHGDVNSSGFDPDIASAEARFGGGKRRDHRPMCHCSCEVRKDQLTDNLCSMHIAKFQAMYRAQKEKEKKEMTITLCRSEIEEAVVELCRKRGIDVDPNKAVCVFMHNEGHGSEVSVDVDTVSICMTEKP